MKKTQPFLGHLDADCFYVSAERVRYEELVGVPIGVMGNQGACVIAKSYEMKAMGVGTGTPIWDALRACPDGLYMKRDFRWYEVLSRLMLAMAREFSPLVEYYSIDEFFFEAHPSRGMDHQRHAEMIRDKIMEAVGVPVTVGIARSKTLAKLISDSAKPFGAKAVLDRQGEEALMAGLPVTEISGISGRREFRLSTWGIRTCLEMANADRRVIRQELTATGEALWWELNGQSVLPISPKRIPHKVLSRGGSFGEVTTSPSRIYGWLVRNLERLVEELEYHEVRAGKIRAWVGYHDGREGQGGSRLTAPSDRIEDLLDAFRPALRKAWIPKAEAGRMHLFAERLTPRGSSQLGLFEGPAGWRERSARVAEVKREINARHGRFMLRSAATLALPEEIYGDPAHGYDICDVRGKVCF